MQLSCFCGGDVLLARVRDKHRVRERVHAAESPECVFQVCYLPIDEQALELGKLRQLALLPHVRELLEAAEALFDFRKVGERTAYPAAGAVRLVEALSHTLERLARLGFASDKEDGLALRRELFDKLLGGLKKACSLLEVKQLYAAFDAENIPRRGGVPARRRVAEVGSGREKLIDYWVSFCHIEKGLSPLIAMRLSRQIELRNRRSAYRGVLIYYVGRRKRKTRLCLIKVGTHRQSVRGTPGKVLVEHKIAERIKNSLSFIYLVLLHHVRMGADNQVRPGVYKLARRLLLHGVRALLILLAPVRKSDDAPALWAQPLYFSNRIRGARVV